MSSDGLKAIGSANTTNTNISHNSTIDTNNSVDTEPYYDTVPIEETDDDDADVDSNKGSRKHTTSSLPKVFDRQISADMCGQVGERVSNYINIDYFLS